MRENKTCAVCGVERGEKSFYKIPFCVNQTFFICKSCVQKQIKKHIELLDNQCAAFWLTCAQLNVPFIQKVWEATEPALVNIKPSSDMFAIYLLHLTEFGKKFDGFWQSDVMLDKILEMQTRTQPMPSLNYKEQQKIWGKFFDEKGNVDKEAYNFLNETYESYTKEVIAMDTNLENRYRDLSKCELRLRKANELGDGAEIGKAQDSLNKQLALLRMNEFKSSNKSDEQLAFEKRVAMIEYSKPAECEDLKKYLDMVGYEKDTAKLMRSLRNAIAETRNYPNVPKEERSPTS